MPKKLQKQQKSAKKTTKKTKKKPLNIFVRIFLFLFIILASAITYVSITLSISPRSIPTITKNIESILSKALEAQVKIDDSQLQITSNINLKLITNNVEIIDKNTHKTITTLPEVDIEIPILQMLIGNFNPNKLIISNANLNIEHNSQKPAKKHPQHKNNQAQIDKTLKHITKFLTKLKDNSHKNSIFAIYNSNITINHNNKKKSIYIKHSEISSDYNFDKLIIHFHNKITINHSQKQPFTLNSKCIINKKEEYNCQIQAKNLKAHSFSWLHKKLSILKDIHSTFNITSRLKYNNHALQDLQFNAISKNGDFKYHNFFDKQINYSKLEAIASYNNKDKNFNLKELLITLKKDHPDYKKYNIDPSIKLTLNILAKKELYDLELNNILINELDKFWPSQLAKEGSRKWSITHLKDGFIKQANAKFELQKGKLKDIDAQLQLADTSIFYSPKFPKISNVKAIINFDNDTMNINIDHGKILQSTLHSANIRIDDLSNRKSRLKISGKISGYGSNLLEHVAYRSNFAKHIKQYFNGHSTSQINLSIPLNKPTTTTNLALTATSNITNNNNQYIKGHTKIDIKTTKTSPDFTLKLTSQKSKININILGIHKNNDDPFSLSLTANTKDLDKIMISPINISQGDNHKTIQAHLEFDTSPFKITKLTLKNKHFTQNDYDLDFNIKTRKLSIKGFNLDLSHSIADRSIYASSKDSISLDFSKLQIALNNLQLDNNNTLNDSYIFYDCDQGLCKDGVITLMKNKKQFLKINLKKDDNYTNVSGKIFNVGELAESLGISDLVKNGKAKIEAKNTSKNNKFALSGEIKIYSPITIFENESIKLLERDNLYSTVKDKIFSNQKTTFHNVRIKFELVGKILTIKSLIANNYKIGITAKGTIDLENKIYDLNGFILPAYVINNLFGLGDIPVIGKVANLLTNGKDGGIFGIKYIYYKKKDSPTFNFKTNKMSALVPTTIQGMF